MSAETTSPNRLKISIVDLTFIIWALIIPLAFGPRSLNVDGDLPRHLTMGEFVLNGLRNRDLARHLFAPTKDEDARRRTTAAVTRKLRMLRAHGLLRKVPATTRYHVTARGRLVIAAILAAHEASARKLFEIAA